MAVLAGIDEAGYGPVLGPLVVAGTAFRVPESEADSDLWKALSSAVTRGGREAGGRVRVADSKRVHRGEGVGALEGHTLPFLRLATPTPGTIRALVTNLMGRAPAEWEEYPWYRGRDRVLPRAHSEGEIAERTSALRRGLRVGGAEFCGARARVVEVGEFNADVAALRNKSAVAMRRVGELLVEMWEAYGAQDLRVAVDKQGGRDDYEAFLRANFFGCALATRRQDSASSEYVVREGARRMEVVFRPGADARHLPVALGSMVAKYVRELMMEMFNDFWLQRAPEARPTAGYYTDGHRFLREIEGARQSLGTPLELLARCR